MSGSGFSCCLVGDPAVVLEEGWWWEGEKEEGEEVGMD